MGRLDSLLPGGHRTRGAGRFSSMRRFRYVIADVFTDAALGVVGSGLPVERYELGPGHVFIELGSPEEVAALRPNLIALEEATNDGVNCFAHVGGARWKTRMFAPGHGVGEDPATGSAAGPLAIHLARHGRIGYGEQIEIAQGAELKRPST